MNAKIIPEDIDQVIHERVRLMIVSTLAMVQEMSFKDLKALLSLTDGNLSAHARKLEDSGYIEIDKTFRKRRPYTALRLTPQGRMAYQRYLGMLEKIVEQGKESE
jgi:DNA-binding MarR family transcriptional regulator